MWVVAAVLAIVACNTAAACTTDVDCSLNGDCIAATSQCKCDSGWTGDNCGTLDLLPTPPEAGYFNSSAHTWGGLPVQDSFGDWHLFTAEMTLGCTLQLWKTNSAVMRAVSQSGPLGPYLFKERVLQPFAHNPAPRIDPSTGRLLLYFIGGWSRNQTNCSADLGPFAEVGHRAEQRGGNAGMGNVAARSNLGVWVPDCGPPPLNDGCGIHMTSAASPEGPWDDVSYVNVTNAPWACARTNPAAWILSNGTVILGMNAGYCHSGDEQLAVAWAPTGWRGPYSMLKQGPAIPGSIRDEDPFLWRNRRGYHMLAHGLQSTTLEGRLAFSEDGYTWQLASTPAYNRTIVFSNGTTVQAATVQRPQILFDPSSSHDDPQPMALWNGVGIGSMWNSHTLVRPINTPSGRKALSEFVAPVRS